MRLTDREVDKLLVSLAAMIARDRRARGLKLNYPEAVALIASGLMERARDGASVAELMGMQGGFLNRRDVMDGIPEMIDSVQVEAARHVAQPHPMNNDTPGAIVHGDGDPSLNEGRPVVELEVTNTGDRAIQVGSHFHLFEANVALRFDRREAFGLRLNIPSGTAVRGRPKVPLLNEPTEGIQPNIVEEIQDVIGSLRGRVTILLVEQFLSFALANADQCYVLERGRVTLSGTPATLDLAKLQDALAV